MFTYDVSLFLFGSCFGFISSGLLVINNTRDIDTDKLVNKRTFAVRFGKLFSYIEYSLFVYLPIIILDYLTNDSPIQYMLLILLVFFGFFLTYKFKRCKDEAFNDLLLYHSIYLIVFTVCSIFLIK